VIDHTAVLLVMAVVAVGVLHTLVPDHWAPIVILARQQGWSVVRTARSAALAGFGHVTTTLLLGAIVWIVGASLAVRYAHFVSFASALALIAFGLWIAYAGWREVHGGHGHADPDFGHAHVHRHEAGLEHVHWHEHHEDDWHPAASSVATMHSHEHVVAGRTALLLILGSSPMIEGIPLFLSASTKGPVLLAIMSVAFALATIVTYIVMCAAGVRGLQRASLGPLERYGEVLSGLFVAAVGLFALVTS
jgi:ABC-type nickel/cobalt efflux system permease component RcnA